MPISEKARDAIRKYAIKNAMDYGRADMGSVMNKTISKFPEVKADIKALKAEVADAIAEVNALSKTDLEKSYTPFKGEFEKEGEERAKQTAKPKMVIEGAKDGEVFTRFPPEPGGYIHIGNMKQCILSEEFARIYNGQIYLYFDDTNPEKCKQEFVDGIKRDTAWLGIKFGKEYYASDYVAQMYDYARQLIKQGNFYLCACSQEDMKKMRFEGTECKHRNGSVAHNQRQFEDMLSGKFDEGKIVVRFKGDMKSLNTVMRDPVMLRIVNAPHFRQGTKYKVWAVYDFNTPIMDSLNGVTDVIRSKEYELRDELGTALLKLLGLRAPRVHSEARLNIKGTTTAKRVMRKLLEQGAISSWDDPRLTTIVALRRRGIQPDAIRALVLRFGMSLTDGSVPIEMLLSENKKLIDPIAKHLFFVHDPVKVTVDGAEVRQISMRLHPTQEMGFREYEVAETFYIGDDDAGSMTAEEVIRLKDLMDILIIRKGDAEILAEMHEGTSKDRIVQWVSDGGYAKCSVIVPGELVDDEGNFRPDSVKTLYGFVESYAEQLQEHDIVQFERFGYCILDNKENMRFIFISK